MNKPNGIREILELYDFGELSALEAKQAITSLITEARLNEVQRAYESRNNATPEAHAEYFRDRIAELEKERTQDE